MTISRKVIIAAVAFMLLFTGSCNGQGEPVREQGGEVVASAKNAAPEKNETPAPVFNCTSAGQWFPGEPSELRAMVSDFMSMAGNNVKEGRVVAIMSPHAGYRFSAPIAAYSYAAVKGKSFDTVVVVGLSHHQYAPHTEVYPDGVFRTPLGDIPIDAESAKQLAAASNSIVEGKQLFAGEHSLETQLPFLQVALKDFKLVPVLMGSQEQKYVDDLADALAKTFTGKNVLLVGSTDMSHFWEYEEANKLDAQIAGLLENYNLDGIAEIMKPDPTGRRMCGHGGARAVFEAARKLGADKIQLLKYANSKDTYGDTGRGVVGYLAAAALDTDGIINVDDGVEKMENNSGGENVSGEIDLEARKELLEIARNSLESYVNDGIKITVETETPDLQLQRGMFVTLEMAGRLRGCMGHFENDTPIGQLAASQILMSAVQDPRFPPVRPDEVDIIDIEISVLSVPEPVDSYEDIVVGKHGVILFKNGRGATFLPQVAPEQGWDRDTMLTHLAMKAGLPGDAWKEGAEFKVYTAEIFSEQNSDE